MGIELKTKICEKKLKNGLKKNSEELLHFYFYYIIVLRQLKLV